MTEAEAGEILFNEEQTKMTKINTLKDTMQALLDGKKIKSESWGDGEFIQLNKDGRLVDERGNIAYIELLADDFFQVYKEPEEELKLENLKAGDILYSEKEGVTREVLAIYGNIAFLSSLDNFTHFGRAFTQKELINRDYKLKNR